jgi:colanic acid/amylovoran biosynthesis glycosyltransferase
MQIAFIVDEFPSLSQIFVLNQITGLIDRGHDVDIFAIHATSDLKIHEDVKRYNLLEHVIYPRIPPNKIYRFFKGMSYLVKFITKYPLPLLRSLNIFKYGRDAANLSLLYQVIPFLEKGPYDIIHCQFGVLGFYGLCLKQITSVTAKLVTSFRGYDISRYVHNRHGIYEELFREGDLFFPVCQFLKKRIIREGCNKNKIIALPSGIDCEKFKYSRRKRLEGEPTKVLTIARLVEKKGIIYAIEAIARLIKSGRCVNYVVVGDGELRGDLERLIEDLGITTNVQLLGWRNQGEVIRLMQSSHILVAPSVTATNGDQEGIPNVLKEAMALGLPVISTDHGGIPELVEDGVSGFLVKERDVDSLTIRLSYLIDHPEIWPEMGRAGSACVQKYYDSNKLNDQLVNLYDRLLQGIIEDPTIETVG